MPAQKANRPTLSQDEVAAIVAKNVATERAFKKAKDTRQLARDKYAEEGADLKTLDKWTKKVIKQEAGADVRAEVGRDLLYAAAAGYEVEQPADLFEGVPEAARSGLSWREKGRQAAAGGFAVPPDGLAGVDLQEWQAGANDYIAAIGRGIKQLERRAEEEAEAKAAATDPEEEDEDSEDDDGQPVDDAPDPESEDDEVREGDEDEEVPEDIASGEDDLEAQAAAIAHQKAVDANEFGDKVDPVAAQAEALQKQGWSRPRQKATAH